MNPYKITVNADRMFSKVGRYFSSVSSAISEAVQNAYRSYCPIATGADRPVIDIEVAGRSITITDSGRGIRNFARMLSLAESDWENDVEGDQDPAGLGVCGILAYCETATWASNGVLLTVHGSKFLSSAPYRDDLISHAVRTYCDVPGTRLTMHNVPGSDDLVSLCTSVSRWYRNVVIRVNGKVVSCEKIPGVHCGTVAGSDVYLAPDANAFGGKMPVSPRMCSVVVLWHGALIPVPDVDLRETVYLNIADANGENINGIKVDISPSRQSVLVIDVGAGAEAERTVTPKLPDRSSLVLNDMTLATLRAAWRLAVVERAKQVVEFYESYNVRTKSDYRSFVVGPDGVNGWTLVYPHRHLVICGTTEVHDRNGNNDGELVERIVRRSDIRGCISSSSAHLVIIDGNTSTIRSFNNNWGTCAVAGDEDEDTFAGGGYYREVDNEDVPRYVVAVIVDATSKDSRYPVYVENHGSLRVWLLPEEEVEANGVLTTLDSEAAIAFPDVSDISFTETDANSGSLAEDIVIVTAGSNKTYAVSSSLNDWRDYYRTRLQEDVRSAFDDGDSESAKQIQVEYEAMWDDQMAEWNGAARVFNLLRDVRAKLPAGIKGISVSFPLGDTIECTMPDGSISAIPIE